MGDAEKPHKHHHAKQAGPKAKKREESVKKKKGTLEQSKTDHKNTRVSTSSGVEVTHSAVLRRLLHAVPAVVQS
jgi:hypothetical protein